MSEMEIDAKGFELMVKAALDARPVEATIVTSEKRVEDYWGVTEYGSREGQRPWPRPRQRTARGPGGRIFSKQAIGGWIFKHGDRFLGFLKTAYFSVADRTDGAPSESELASAVNEAGEQTLAWLKRTAPVDEGTLRDSLKLEKAR